eukprot:PhF_6_TR2529/c0_g1_i1/m.4296/K14860/TMA16; translation machinery-associated protein 16
MSTIGKVLHATSGKSRNGARQGGKVVHPDSRRAVQLGRKVIHTERQKEIQETKALRRADITSCIEWFHAYVCSNFSDVRCLQPYDLKEACLKYVTRFDQDIAISRSAGKKSELECLRASLVDQYDQDGLIVPELTTRLGYQWLVNWDGSTEQALKVPMVKLHYGERPADVETMIKESPAVFTLGTKKGQTKIQFKEKPQTLKAADAQNLVTGGKTRRIETQQRTRKTERKEAVKKARARNSGGGDQDEMI